MHTKPTPEIGKLDIINTSFDNHGIPLQQHASINNNTEGITSIFDFFMVIHATLYNALLDR